MLTLGADSPSHLPRTLFLASEDSLPHQQAYAPLRQGLSHPAPLFVAITSPEAQHWLHHFDCHQCLIITSGPAALKKTLETTRQAQVLSIMITMNQHQQLLQHLDHNERFAALFMDLPLTQRLEIAKQHIPMLRQFTMVTSPQDQAHRMDWPDNLTVFIHDPKQHLLEPFIHAARHGDAIVTQPDRDIYNAKTLISIMMTTYRLGIPLIGHSEALHRAGAMLSIYADPEMLGKEALALLREQAPYTTQPLPQRHTTRYQVVINHQMARSLQIHVETP
ncbi:hypothetical protein SAMN05421693_11360 [Ectothiorhodospira magna]|uniref:Uncharacterized protein n=2 Tax=Ectothiorhodospira magna TaxID=867345 RepID=A0A1H9CE27_9GAMM|nr:hypothetical protein SAMN05421693_11360 [Ectothiorhodospira magna]